MIFTVILCAVFLIGNHANLRYEVGQTVTDVIPLNLPEYTEQPKTNPRRWISAVSALAACLVLVLCLTVCSQPTAGADTGISLRSGGTLVLRVNPEIAVEYDEKGLVTGVVARNEDAIAVIDDCTGLIGGNVRDAVTQLVAAIGTAGYFIEESVLLESRVCGDFFLCLPVGTDLITGLLFSRHDEITKYCIKAAQGHKQHPTVLTAFELHTPHQCFHQLIAEHIIDTIGYSPYRNEPVPVMAVPQNIRSISNPALSASRLRRRWSISRTNGKSSQTAALSCISVHPRASSPTRNSIAARHIRRIGAPVPSTISGKWS